MKQRTRIRRLKAHLYPWWIYADRRQKAWEMVRTAEVRLSRTLREAYAKARAALEAQT
jgi:hypothetical protein